jgi:hypothetical protein
MWIGISANLCIFHIGLPPYIVQDCNTLMNLDMETRPIVGLVFWGRNS